MKLLHSPSMDPFFNLALEEHLFENVKEDFILIYVNSDSVVCGKHQNAVAETNSKFLQENNVPFPLCPIQMYGAQEKIGSEHIWKIRLPGITKNRYIYNSSSFILH